MYHALLFFHVLTAFFLATAALIYSAFVLGSPVNRATRLVAEILWGVGGLGTLVIRGLAGAEQAPVRDFRRLDHRRARPLGPGNGIRGEGQPRGAADGR